MITLDQIASGNLQRLKNQEAELLHALEFVRKAKQLFESRGSSGGNSSAPKTKSVVRKKARKKVAVSSPKKSKSKISKPAKASMPVKAAKSKSGAGKETRLSKIISAMKQKNTPVASGECRPDPAASGSPIPAQPVAPAP